MTFGLVVGSETTSRLLRFEGVRVRPPVGAEEGLAFFFFDPVEDERVRAWPSAPPSLCCAEALLAARRELPTAEAEVPRADEEDVRVVLLLRTPSLGRRGASRGTRAVEERAVAVTAPPPPSEWVAAVVALAFETDEDRVADVALVAEVALIAEVALVAEVARCGPGAEVSVLLSTLGFLEAALLLLDIGAPTALPSRGREVLRLAATVSFSEVAVVVVVIEARFFGVEEEGASPSPTAPSFANGSRW